MKEFKSNVKPEYIEYRNIFRDNYSWLEKYCKNKYGRKGNFFNRFISDFDITEDNEEEIKSLIEIDYIRSENYNYRVSPTIVKATDFLRNYYSDKYSELELNNNPSMALFELLKQIRNNLIHDGKFELGENQLKRNMLIVKNSSIILGRIIQKL